MMEEKQIEKWIEKGIITQGQSMQIIEDLRQSRKERSSSRFITAISTIGALLLGVGVILFMASNWEKISDIIKIILLLTSTLGAYGSGYFFCYQRQNFPKVGAALIFLSSLLFGATLFLIAQMYHSEANAHWLILIWMLGVIPVIYVLESIPNAVLASLLFFVWVWLYFFGWGSDFFFSSRNLEFFPIFYLISGVAFFALGSAHSIFIFGYQKVARVYRLTGLQVTLFSLFLLSFEAFSKISKHRLDDWNDMPKKIMISLIIGTIIALVFSAIGIFNSLKSQEKKYLEGALSTAASVLGLIFFLSPSSTVIYPIIFNLFLAGTVIAMLWEGYKREDMKIVNLGMFWLEILIIARYFDFFWDLLPRSAFFIAGGAILIGASFILEKKRRQLKKTFEDSISFTNSSGSAGGPNNLSNIQNI
jgi:uncharacterized membrane protein